MQIPWTGSQATYTPHLQYFWNPVKHLGWNFFAELVNVSRPLAIFPEDAPSWMFAFHQWSYSRESWTPPGC